MAWVVSPTQQMPSDAHCALRAELLAAETVNACAAGDPRTSANHCDCLCRADLRALSAADAGAFQKFGVGGQDPSGDGIGQLPDRSAPKHIEENVCLRRNSLIIRHAKALRITEDGEMLRRLRNKPAPDRSRERRHITDAQTDQMRGDEIERVPAL